MSDRLNIDALRRALQLKGMQQNELAAKLEVTDAAVSQWLSGTTEPKPATLLKMARAVGLTVAELLVTEEPAPLVAYRRKGQQKTTEFNEDEALDQAYALDALVDLLPPRTFRPPSVANANPTYRCAELAAAEQRSRLDTEPGQPVSWRSLMKWFADWQAVVVPVFWGERENHGNALHIHLPRTNHTFVFINLDSERLDFKFWLAHEMAHVLTPDMVGSENGEDFADLFAGALLFPRDVAAEAYREAVGANSAAIALNTMADWARKWEVSLFTVYSQCNRLAEDRKVPPLKIDSTAVHAARRRLDKTLPKIRDELFEGQTPDVHQYIDVAARQFGGEFFNALAQYVGTREGGPTYIRRCMHATLRDSLALYGALTKGAEH